jgi:alkylation response protein AidB-like acyl-CoA dehydrogenase
MDLLPTDEQSEIVNTVRAQLGADFDLNALAERDWAPSVVDDALWTRCAELGWFSLGLAESLGGTGYGLPEEALLFEQVGAHVTPGPFLATVLAVHVAAGADESELMGSIAAGEKRVALAEPEPGDEQLVRVTDFGDADVLLVLDGATMSLVDATNVEFTPQTSFDPLVPLATASVDLTSTTDGSNALQCSITDRALALRAIVLGAAELAGIALATSEQSTEYVKDREQFGRPVGSFQAVKHRCADMAVRADAAVQLTRLASLAVAGDHQDAAFQAEAARVVAAEAAVTNAEINVQNHGGIGFTYEHTAHRYVTRARVRAGNTGGRPGHLAAMLDADSPT